MKNALRKFFMLLLIFGWASQLMSNELHDFFKNSDKDDIEAFKKVLNNVQGNKITMLNEVDDEGATVLMRAVTTKSTRIVGTIVNQPGINLDAQKNTDGTTALHQALYLDDIATTEPLLRHKLNLNIQDTNGFTPLMIATNTGSPGLVAEIIKNGADITRKNNKDQTALTLAQECLKKENTKKQQYQIIIDLLKSVSSDPLTIVTNLLKTLKEKLTQLLLQFTKLTQTVNPSSHASSPLDVLNQKYGSPIITLVCGDTVKSHFDDPLRAAIVNAANEGGLGGGGIDGAIHSAAGNELRKWIAKNVQEVKKNIRVPEGEARWTPSFNIKPQGKEIYIILTTGPQGSNPNREVLLKNAYQNSLKLADQTGVTPFQPNVHKKYPITSIVFCAISTAIFGYDIKEATPVALAAIKEYFKNKKTTIKEVRFIAYSKNDYTYFSNYLSNNTESGLTIIKDPAPDFLLQSSNAIAGVPPLMFKIEK